MKNRKWGALKMKNAEFKTDRKSANFKNYGMAVKEIKGKPKDDDET